jgi:hypothetical protein
MTTFSPSWPASSARSSSIVLPSYLSPLMCACLRRTSSSSFLRHLPSAISAADVLGLVGGLLLVDAELGLLDVLRDVLLGHVAQCRDRGDVHRDLAGEADEVVVAATKSVLQSTSTSTPTLPLAWM